MTHDNIMELLNSDSMTDNSDVISILSNCITMVENKWEIPYLISETVELLSDGHVIGNLVSDDNKISLVKMLRTYFKMFYTEYNDVNKLATLNKFSHVKSYWVEAANGERMATVNEIEECVTGIYTKDVYIAGEEFHKLLSLLLWTMTGNTYYYRHAGFKNNYSEGKVIDTFYQMISNSASMLMQIFEKYGKHYWITCIDEVTKFKRRKGIRYAEYAEDEIREDVSIKQVFFVLNKQLNKNTCKDEAMYKRGIALILKVKNTFGNQKAISVTDKAYLREVLKECAKNIKDNKQEEETNKESTEKEETNEVMNMAKILRQKRYSGLIDKDAFVYKIIDTLDKYKFSKYSAKQYGIIKEAYDKVCTDDKESQSVEDTELQYEDDDETLSDFIGNGLFN